MLKMLTSRRRKLSTPADSQFAYQSKKLRTREVADLLEKNAGSGGVVVRVIADNALYKHIYSSQEFLVVGVEEQERIVFQDSCKRFISVALDYHEKMRIIRSDDSETEPTSLRNVRDVLTKNKRKLTVVFNEDKKIRYRRDKPGVMNWQHFGTMCTVTSYNVRHLVAYQITSSSNIKMLNISSCPIFFPVFMELQFVQAKDVQFDPDCVTSLHDIITSLIPTITEKSTLKPHQEIYVIERKVEKWEFCQPVYLQVEDTRLMLGAQSSAACTITGGQPQNTDYLWVDTPPESEQKPPKLPTYSSPKLAVPHTPPVCDFITPTPKSVFDNNPQKTDRPMLTFKKPSGARSLSTDSANSSLRAVTASGDVSSLSLVNSSPSAITNRTPEHHSKFTSIAKTSPKLPEHQPSTQHEASSCFQWPPAPGDTLRIAQSPVTKKPIENTDKKESTFYVNLGKDSPPRLPEKERNASNRSPEGMASEDSAHGYMKPKRMYENIGSWMDYDEPLYANTQSVSMYGAGAANTQLLAGDITGATNAQLLSGDRSERPTANTLLLPTGTAGEYVNISEWVTFPITTKTYSKADGQCAHPRRLIRDIYSSSPGSKGQYLESEGAVTRSETPVEYQKTHGNDITDKRVSLKRGLSLKNGVLAKELYIDRHFAQHAQSKSVITPQVVDKNGTSRATDNNNLGNDHHEEPVDGLSKQSALDDAIKPSRIRSNTMPDSMTDRERSSSYMYKDFLLSQKNKTHTLTPADVSEILKKIDLPHFVNEFLRIGIDGRVLFSMGRASLQRLGFTDQESDRLLSFTRQYLFNIFRYKSISSQRDETTSNKSKPQRTRASNVYDGVCDSGTALKSTDDVTCLTKREEDGVDTDDIRNHDEVPSKANVQNIQGDDDTTLMNRRGVGSVHIKRLSGIRSDANQINNLNEVPRQVRMLQTPQKTGTKQITNVSGVPRNVFTLPESENADTSRITHVSGAPRNISASQPPKNADTTRINTNVSGVSRNVCTLAAPSNTNTTPNTNVGGVPRNVTTLPTLRNSNTTRITNVSGVSRNIFTPAAPQNVDTTQITTNVSGVPRKVCTLAAPPNANTTPNTNVSGVPRNVTASPVPLTGTTNVRCEPRYLSNMMPVREAGRRPIINVTGVPKNVNNEAYRRANPDITMPPNSVSNITPEADRTQNNSGGCVPSNVKTSVGTTRITRLSDVPEDITFLTSQQVIKCLQLLNLEKHTECFTKRRIDGFLLKTLTAPMLAELGLTQLDAHFLNMFLKGWRPHSS